MAIFIENLLDEYTLEAIAQTLEDPSRFEDGKKSAGGVAKKVKYNQQAQASDVQVAGAQKQIEKALRNHSIFKSAAIPKQFAKILFSRYEPGMSYGSHVDDALIAGVRTDLSFTLFLSEPDSYDGGELVIQRPDGDEVVKLPKGSLYLYPSNTLHRVAEVTKGTRLAAVGWVESYVRLEEHRAILFELSSALRALKDTEENQSVRLQLLQTYNNLLRLSAN